MAKYRHVRLSFWTDAEILDSTFEQKSFYQYLLTNPQSHQCGIYELSLQSMLYHTGLPREKCKELLEYWIDKGKVKYNWETKEIAIKNWLKYNYISSKPVRECTIEGFKKIKDRTLLQFIDIPDDLIIYQYEWDDPKSSKSIPLPDGMDTVTIPLPDGMPTVCELRGQKEKEKEKEKQKEKEKEKEDCSQGKPAKAPPIPTFDEIWKKDYRINGDGKRTSVYQRIFDTFWYFYPQLYGQPLMLRNGKHLKLIQTICKMLDDHIKDFNEQLYITSYKMNLLFLIAKKRNKYQNWKFIPTDLYKRWDELTDKCVIDEWKNKHDDPSINEYVKRNNELYNKLKKSGLLT